MIMSGEEKVLAESISLSKDYIKLQMNWLLNWNILLVQLTLMKKGSRMSKF